jgi:hypothetical protein
MRRFAYLILICAVFATASASMPVAGQEKARGTFLHTLKKGQTIGVKEAGGRFEISLTDDVLGPRGFTVTEVGADYVQIEDLSGTVERRISVYAISSIVRVKNPRRK